MNEKLFHLLDLFLANKNNDIGKKIKHFNSITNSLFVLTQSLFDNKQKVKYHQRELEGKLFRFGLANQSLINLIKGNQFTLINKIIQIGDIFSINNITRMQIESYLIMYYLFFDEVLDSEKDFRYDIYKLHGLQKQINFKTASEFPEKKKYQEKINLEMNEAITNIKSSDLYKSSSEKKKQEYLKPQYAKLIKNDILFKKSGIDDMRVSEMWKIYSNYAHSEHISDRQYNTLYKIEKSITNSCSLIITINTFLTSKLILNFKKLFICVDQKYEGLNSIDKHHIEFWNEFKSK